MRAHGRVLSNWLRKHSSWVGDLRSHACGRLSVQDEGQRVVLGGWIQTVRQASADRAFVGLRDAKGVVQLVVDPSKLDSQQISVEDVVKVTGKVVCRPAETRNLELVSGGIEVQVETLEKLNAAKNLAIPIERYLDSSQRDSKKKLAHELQQEVRLKHRHLDLRGVTMQRNLRVRAASVLRGREILSRDLGFIEVETPSLFKSTPEGAREFLVPTRNLPAGTCYALTQSPQQYKQLLMAGGVERYFQFARCFRDESGTRERQPEFTQLDMEMSFVDAAHVRNTIEQVVSGMWVEAHSAAIDCAYASSSPGANLGHKAGEDENADVESRWVERNVPSTLRAGKQFFSAQAVMSGFLPLVPFQEALEVFGSDKPDRRFGMHLDATPQKILSEPNDDGGVVIARSLLVRPSETNDNFRQSGKGLQALADEYALHGVCVACVIVDEQDNGWKKVIFSKQSRAEERQVLLGLSADAKHELLVNLAGEPQRGDVLVLAFSKLGVSGPHFDNLSRGAWGESARRAVCECLGKIRSKIGKPDTSKLDLFWVVDFPLFEIADAAKGTHQAGLKAVHHPFTMPHAQDVEVVKQFSKASRPEIDESILRVRGQHYDLVCNGMELGGGSVRIHDACLQEHVFRNILGIDSDKVQEYFAHLLVALSSGCPPHAGFALGVDRLFNIMCETPNLTDVIAFPKSLAGNELLTGAPTTLPDQALAEYHLLKKEPTSNEVI